MPVVGARLRAVCGPMEGFELILRLYFWVKWRVRSVACACADCVLLDCDERGDLLIACGCLVSAHTPHAPISRHWHPVRCSGMHCTD